MKLYEKICPVCNKAFKGTKMREICSDKCSYIRQKQLVQMTCKECGKVEMVPRYYCKRCTECHRIYEKKRKAQSTTEKQLNTLEQYAQWHKANPNKSYGDYQTMQRIEKGEIVCQQ